MICSFDFDGTLTRPEVFEYARELQRRGLIVCITTARCEFRHHEFLGANPNDDLLAAAYDLNRCEVLYVDETEWYQETKIRLLLELSAEACAPIAFHLDDDSDELHGVGNNGVDVTKPDWRRKCEGKINARAGM